VVQPFVKSAHSYGFDEKIMKDEFLSKIFFYDKIKLGLYEDLKTITN